jgi:hypothetical protein
VRSGRATYAKKSSLFFLAPQAACVQDVQTRTKAAEKKLNTAQAKLS